MTVQLKIPVKSPITIWWILLCVLVMGFAVAVMVFVVKRTMERKAVYQPVPAEPTPGDPVRCPPRRAAPRRAPCAHLTRCMRRSLCASSTACRTRGLRL